MSVPAWSGRSLSSAELLEWLRLNSNRIKHLTVAMTFADGAIDVKTSVHHRECQGAFRELSAHAAALQHAASLSVSVKEGVIQP